MITTERPRVDGDTGRGGPPKRRSVLVIATTESLRRSVSRILARVPFDVADADSAELGLAAAAEERPDLVVVETGVAAASHRYLHDLRLACRAPIMLVGPDRAQGLSGLESGTAVDFIGSPVWGRELRARAVRHAGAGTDADIRSFGDLRIDGRARSVSVAGRQVALTQREFDLLEFLASHPGTAFTRRQLLERVWGSSPEWQQAGTITEHVYRLRRKLEPDPASPKYIVTVRPSGYRFDDPADAVIARGEAV